MKNILRFILFAALLSGLNSCNKDEGNNPVFVRMEIIDVDMPDTFQLGRTYEIRVTYKRPDGCTRLQGFDVYPVEQTVREVVAVGARYEDKVCPEVLTEETGQFLFQVVYRQAYTFKFWQSEDADGNTKFLEKTVPVQ